jgi:hypothetical protein
MEQIYEKAGVVVIESLPKKEKQIGTELCKGLGYTTYENCKVSS